MHSDDGNVLAQLAIDNLQNVQLLCGGLYEYGRRSEDASLRSFAVDPDACSRSTVINVLPDNSTGIFGIRQLLRHSLRCQRHKLYAAWWCCASTVEALQCSVLDMADALDTSLSVASWGIAAVEPIVRTFAEQQRVRGRCTVFVLEHCAEDALLYFMRNLCPAWGAIVYVLPRHPLPDAVLSEVRSFVPDTTVCTPPLLQGEGSAATPLEWNDLQNDRVRNVWIAHVLSTILDNASDDLDTSYMVKFFEATGYRSLMLRLFVALMKIGRMDSYEAFHAIKDAADAAKTQALTAYADCSQGDATLAYHAYGLWSCIRRHVLSTCGHAMQDELLLVALLPPCVPSSMYSRECADFLLWTGVATLATNAQGAHSRSTSLLCVPLWFSGALLAVMPPDLVRRACAVSLERIHVLDTMSMADEFNTDASLFRLHDALCLGTKRVQQTTTSAEVETAKHADAAVALLPPVTPPATTPRSPDGVDIGSGDAENPLLVGLPRTGTEPWRHVTRVWLRWRGNVLRRILDDFVFPNKWFFAEIPTLPPVQLIPPIKRSFESLMFGLPPLPEDDEKWSPVLASLYLRYAVHYREQGDSLNAAAAMERALCVYLFFVDTSATLATSKFAVMLSPKLPNAEELGRKATSSHLGRRGSSRRSVDSDGADIRSLHSGFGGGGGMGAQSFMRKMSRLTQMTQESNQSSKKDGLSTMDEQAYAHVFSLLLLGIESIYRQIANDYAQANVQGVAVPLLDRGIATLELLNMNRRDTPARAVTLYRRGEKELMLSALEKRRGKVIQHAEEMQEDEGDMKLKALVKADVEERHHLRSAAAHMKECLNILRINRCPRLVAKMTAVCNEVVSRHYLVDVGDKDAAEFAEASVESLLAQPEMTGRCQADLPRDIRPASMLPSFAATFEELRWARANLGRFLNAIEHYDYVLANEMLDRSLFLGCLGLRCRPRNAGTCTTNASQGLRGDDEDETLLPSMIVCSGCGDLTQRMLDECMPDLVIVEHLHVWTSYSAYDVAGHHGNNWSGTPSRYALPLLTLLWTICRTDEARVADGNALFRRLMEECHGNPLACSPDDMKTALHIAVERSLGDIAQYLLQHPLVDPLVSAPRVWKAARHGLSTLPNVASAPNPTPCPLYFCPLENSTMLMILLLGSKDPQFTFQAAKFTILERLAQDRDAHRFLSYLFDADNAPFAAHAQNLLVAPELCSETREAMAKHCSREAILWGFQNVKDPHVLLGLCSAIAAWGVDGGAATLLVNKVAECMRSEDWVMADAIYKRFAAFVTEEALPYDLHKEYKKWLQGQPSNEAPRPIT